MFFDNQDANAADPFLHAVGDEAPKLIARRDGRTAKGAEVYLARPDIGRWRIKPFRMASTVVTNAQFNAVADAIGYVTKAEHFGRSFVVWTRVPKRVDTTHGLVDLEWWQWLAMGR